MSEKKQLNVYLDAALIKRTKHATIEAEQRLSDFVAAALVHYLTLVDRDGEER